LSYFRRYRFLSGSYFFHYGWSCICYYSYGVTSLLYRSSVLLLYVILGCLSRGCCVPE